MSDFNGRSLAAIRAEHGALLLAQAGSSLGRKHLSAARWLNNEWSVLWVDAVREVIPGILGTEEDLLAFTARMDSLGDPRLATLEAWRAAIARRGLFAHWGSRALMRVTWHRRWTKIQDRFRGLVIFHAQISSIVNEPARRGRRPR